MLCWVEGEKALSLAWWYAQSISRGAGGLLPNYIYLVMVKDFVIKERRLYEKIFIKVECLCQLCILQK